MGLQIEFEDAKIDPLEEGCSVIFTCNLQGTIFYNHDNTARFDQLISSCKDLLSKHNRHSRFGEMDASNSNLLLSTLYFVKINKLEKLFTVFEYNQDTNVISYELNNLIFS